MISLEKRLELLDRLGKYMASEKEAWIEIKEKAEYSNPWFTGEHIDIAIDNIVFAYLDRKKLEKWIVNYSLTDSAKKLGIVMAGNIPLVGFHDFLCGFISGHDIYLKLSSKDEVLMKHIVDKLTEWEPEAANYLHIAENLKNCDAYIATGSNNTARYFEQYFAKYPHIIRKNRTSVAILEGDETDEELSLLGKDVFLYFGLGCRNVTQVCIPPGFDLTRLLRIFEEYAEYANHNKYKNNYDYHLAIYLLNRVPYLGSENLLLVENELPFSAVSVLHYRYYTDMKALAHELEIRDDIQTIVGRGFTPFGSSQCPALNEYADGVDTMEFLCSLK
jgi:hypothetical protein